MFEFVLYLARKLVESCARLQKYFLYTSFSGGTCSCHGRLLRQRLGGGTCSHHGTLASAAFVEPYNTVLCSHSSLEHTDFAVMMDNGAMDIEPNRLLAHFISH